MEFANNKYHELFMTMPDAFAYHQVIYDQQGIPIDYIFIAINSAFETMTGLNKEQVIGKKVTEVHPEIGESEFDWIGVYGEVAHEGESIRFEQYFEPADRWYDVCAFSDEPGYFAVLFREVTVQKSESLALTKLASMAQYSLQNQAGDFSYQALSDGLLELSGAKFAAINIYEQNGKKSVTMAVSGVADSIRKICDLLGYELTGKAWDMIPERFNAIKGGRLLSFASLYDAAFGAITKTVAALLAKAFDVGEVNVTEIGFEGETIGDLIMFMPRFRTLENPKVVELYATQVGFALMRYQAENEVRESRDQYQSLVNNIPGTSYRCLYDQNWTMLYMSSDVDNITGYPSSDFINNKVRSYASVICRDDNKNDEMIRAALEEGETWDIEYRVMHSDGSIRWVSEKGRGVKGNNGEIAYIDGLILDITDRKRIEEQLRESELRHRALVNAIPDFLFRFNEEGVYLDAEVKDEKQLYKAARQLYRQQSLVGKAVIEALPAPIASQIIEGIKEALTGGEIVVLEYSYPVEGAERFFEARLAPIGRTEVVSIVRDITERKSYLAELEHISLHDQLTGLYNRRYFENELQRLSVSREYPVVIMSADLDGLKLINDTLGHAEGDSYLKTGAELLKNVLRASDILARVGGDEFALILPRATKKTGEELIVRIRRRIEEYNQHNKGLPISISIGLGVCTSGERSLEDIFKEADNAMYKDKLQRGQLARAGIVASLIVILDQRKDICEGNSAQVKDLAEQFGRWLKLNKKQMADLRLLATVYDLGKINMPDRLIHQHLSQKKGSLSGTELEAIRRHPEIGFRIASSSPELSGVAELILRHHEHYDGSGYPLGLKGEEIPLLCRIIAVIIAYSAMTNQRRYVKVLSPADALAELKRCAGTQFDPQTVEQFAMLFEANDH